VVNQPLTQTSLTKGAFKMTNATTEITNNPFAALVDAQASAEVAKKMGKTSKAKSAKQVIEKAQKQAKDNTEAATKKPAKKEAQAEAATKKPAKKEAQAEAKPETKRARAIVIYNESLKDGKKVVIDRFKTELSMTDAGANSYFYATKKIVAGE
jgi:membrane protein involved in colicin uptake